MNNRIIFEFAQEDRDRLDRITCLLTEVVDRLPKHIDAPTSDPLQAKLAEVLANAKAQPTENASEEPAETTQDDEKPVTPTDTHPEEETPAEAKPEAAPTVTLEQIQQKVVQLCAADGGKKKAQVREIINLYGTKVSDLKERPDKWGEVWGLLTALEKEAIA